MNFKYDEMNKYLFGRYACIKVAASASKSTKMKYILMFFYCRNQRKMLDKKKQQQQHEQGSGTRWQRKKN